MRLGKHAFKHKRTRVYARACTHTLMTEKKHTETHAGEYTFTSTQKKHTLGTENRQGDEKKRQNVRIS